MKCNKCLRETTHTVDGMCSDCSWSLQTYPSVEYYQTVNPLPEVRHCPACKGTGEDDVCRPCPFCNGTGHQVTWPTVITTTVTSSSYEVVPNE